MFFSKIFARNLSILIGLLILPLGLYALPSSTSTKPNNDGLAELVTTLKKIETFSGAFVQFSVDQKGRRVQDSRGNLKAERPGLFYWHTEEPLEQSVYSDGQEVTVFDPDLEQATIQKVDNQSQSTPAIIFSGDADKIGELFKVEIRKFDEKIIQYLLTPHSKESMFERLRLRFDGQHLTEMRLTDALGQESTLSFIQTEVNLTFPKGTFKAKLPEGTDIIRDIPVTTAQAKKP